MLRQQSEDGFTLIELLVIVVILGILAAVVVFGVTNAEGSSARSACQSDFKLVQSAQEAYKAQVGAYATSVNQLVGQYLKEAPVNQHYTITIDTAPGTTHGDVMVGGQDGEGNCANAS